MIQRATRLTCTYALFPHPTLVRADEVVVLEDGAMLVGAVVVAGDGASAHVYARADVGVAHVGQVVGLAVGIQHAVLDFDKVADMGARSEEHTSELQSLMRI